VQLREELNMGKEEERWECFSQNSSFKGLEKEGG